MLRSSLTVSQQIRRIGLGRRRLQQPFSSRATITSTSSRLATRSSSSFTQREQEQEQEQEQHNTVKNNNKLCCYQTDHRHATIPVRPSLVGQTIMTTPPPARERATIATIATTTHTRRYYSYSSIRNSSNYSSYSNNTLPQKSVFVSKHNSSFNVTQDDVLDYCYSHGIIQSSIDDGYSGSSSSSHNKDYRCTNSHVIIKDCPSCTNINDNITNQYKLYIRAGRGSASASASANNSTSDGGNGGGANGAYFCHRCGWKGSWFDFKNSVHQMKGSSNGGFGGGGGSSSSSGSGSGSGLGVGGGMTASVGSSSPFGTTGTGTGTARYPAMVSTSSRYASTTTSTTASSSVNRSASPLPSSSSRYEESTQQQMMMMNNKKPKQQQQNVPPLPMPPPKLQAIYSTALLDGVVISNSNSAAASKKDDEIEQGIAVDNASNASKNSNSTTTTNSNKVLDYLVNVRGLNVATLRKYGVGRATYSFANQQNNWVATECVTFPWIVTVSDAEIQESYRGSKFVWEQQEYIQQQLQEQEQLYRESSYVSVLQQEQQETEESSSSIDTDEENRNSSVSLAVDADTDEQTTKKNTTTTTSMMKKPPTLQEIKNETFITRRIKVRSIEKKEWQRMDPPGGGWGLFGYHTIPKPVSDIDQDKDTNKTSSGHHHQPRRTEREIIITEGEYDAMAVWQATHRPAISLPNGCRSLPVEVLPLLEDFTKIYLWMDNDAAGQEGAELFAKKLGLQRCYIVKPTYTNCRKLAPSSTSSSSKDEKTNPSMYQQQRNSDDMIKQLPKDANDALRQGLDLSLILDDAQLVRHDRIIQFNDLRNDVLHEIMHPDQYVGHPVNSLPGFTSIIKGFRRGELTVLTGPTGSGKTTFLGQLSVDLVEQDVNVLWGSFEIKNIRLIHKLMQQFAREPLPTGDPSMRSKLEALSDRFDRLPFTFLKFHGGTDVEDVLDAMDYAVYVNDVEHIILDNMQFMVSLNSLKGRGGSAFDKFDVQDMAIEKFRKFATDRNVHIVLVIHPKKEAENSNLSISSIYGTAKATQEADTVLILQNDGRRKFIEVKKNRYNGTLGHTPLHFDRQSCRYSETPPVNVSGSSNSGNSSSTSPSSPSSYPQPTSGQRYYSSSKKSDNQGPEVEATDWFASYIHGHK